MKFKLTKTIARQYSCNVVDDEEFEVKESQIVIKKMSVNVRVPDDQDNIRHFAISFETEVCIKLEENVKMSVEFWAFFEADQTLSDEFLQGPFTSINAPAIAFPYLRSFITNSLVNAGYPAVYLPTVNFVELAKKDKN